GHEGGVDRGGERPLVVGDLLRGGRTAVRRCLAQRFAGQQNDGGCHRPECSSSPLPYFHSPSAIMIPTSMLRTTTICLHLYTGPFSAQVTCHTRNFTRNT